VRSRGWTVGVLAGCLTLLGASPAGAVPDCPSPPKAKVLLTGQGRLESIIGDARGRLYFTDLSDNRLLRLDGPGQQPRVLATDMKRPGGLVWEPGGTLVAGFSGGAASGVPGNGMAGLFRVNPETGAKRAFVTGIDQANGLARGRDGSLYTSNDISNEIVRVRPNGSVERHWADVESANGLVIDTTARYLFVAQTFTPAKIARLPLANPGNATTWFSAPPEDTAAGLDGLTRDGADRLYAAANGGGEVWRVTSGNRACALVRDLSLPSSVAFGGGGSFDRRNLYVVTFSGSVIELARATDRPPSTPPGSPGGHKPAKRPKLNLSVHPRVTRAEKRTRFEFTVTSRGRAVAGAKVRLGGDTATTGKHGRAHISRRFDRPGTVHASVSRAGYRAGTVTITVRED
jgi:sugar lactone lactonase YvrE